MGFDWFRSQALNSRDIAVTIIEVEYLPMPPYSSTSAIYEALQSSSKG